ncbi:MAG: TlpA family protein disulfide reductase [Polyangiaceae bacterium]|nr:TlpA family protein disulfide reductase [Polyangiaceae bacterium]
MLFACERTVVQVPPVGVSDKSRASVPDHRPAVYAFDSLDDRPVTSETMRGKPTVVVFLTTGDLLGQAQINYLVAMARNDGDKVNYAMVALHPRKEIVIVDAYAKALNVNFPVALGDPSSTTSEAGPFGAITAVPTTIVLARDGHMVWKHTGLAKSEDIRAHMQGL